MNNNYFKLSKDSLGLIVSIYTHHRYYDDVFVQSFRLDYATKDEISIAVKKWFFGNGRFETHTGIVLSRFENIPTHHRLWNTFHTLKVSDNIYLSAPDMYQFLIKKDGVRPKIDFQLSYHFC